MRNRTFPFLPRERTTLVWIGLIVATILSWAMGTHRIGGVSDKGIGAIVLAVGFLKARYVGLDFMETRHAPPVLRIMMECWCIGAFLVLLVLFLLG